MVAVNAEIERRLQATTAALARQGTLRAAYLFGSHAEGRADQWSDIDVAAFIDGVEGWDIHKRAQVMAAIMQEVGADVEAHLFPASILQDPPLGSFAAHILQHGIPIPI